VRRAVWGILLCSAACGRHSEPILIGLAGPLGRAEGQALQRGAELAVHEINAAGGIEGRLVELVIGDDGGNADSAVAVATALRAADVIAVIGHGGIAESFAAATVHADANTPTPLLVPSAMPATIAETGPHVFRLAPTAAEHGTALATWVRRGLGLQRGMILFRNDPYGREIRQAFSARFEAIGGIVAAAFPFLTGRAVEAAYLEWLLATPGIEFMILAADVAEAESLLRALRGAGLELPVLGSESLEGLEASGGIAEGITRTATYLPSHPAAQNQRFVAEYRQAHPDERPPGQLAASAYDAVYLLRDAAERARPQRAAVLRVLSQTGRELPPFQGVTGLITFDEQGGLAPRPVHIGLIQLGTLVAVERR